MSENFRKNGCSEKKKLKFTIIANFSFTAKVLTIKAGSVAKWSARRTCNPNNCFLVFEWSACKLAG